jgi:hypothetical protein
VIRFDAAEASQICAPADFGAPIRPALVIGHPGHELLVFGWVAATRPRVYVLTDGSGSTGESRADASRQLLCPLNAKLGEVFAQTSDPEFYGAIREGRIPFFVDILDRLVDSFLTHDVGFVLSDAVEGYNPTHDLCGTIAGTAAAIVGGMNGTPLPHFEFSLVEWLGDERHRRGDSCAHLQLGEQLLEKKLGAAQDYRGLDSEISGALAQHGRDYFAVECLREARSMSRFERSKPYYEIVGERRIAQGKFSSVIRYKEHVRPIMEALSRRRPSGRD